jgi:hypothetical protein
MTQKISPLCHNNKFDNQALRRQVMKIYFLAIACLFGVYQVAFAQTRLTPEQIQSDIVGHSMLGRNAQGQTFDFKMFVDGTMKTESFGGDKGVWRLSKDGYCATWERLRGGKEACFQVSKPLLNYLVHNPDGSITTVIKKDPIL